jgi:hypothetical protein
MRHNQVQVQATEEGADTQAKQRGLYLNNLRRKGRPGFESSKGARAALLLLSTIAAIAVVVVVAAAMLAPSCYCFSLLDVISPGSISLLDVISGFNLKFKTRVGCLRAPLV